MSQENFEIVRRMIAAVNHRDVDGYLALCTPDAELVSPITSIEGVAQGTQGIRDYLSRFFEATTSFQLDVEELRALGDDRVLALTRVTAVSKGGVPADQAAASLYDLVDARVRRIEIFFDRGAALEAAGLRE